MQLYKTADLLREFRPNICKQRCEVIVQLNPNPRFCVQFNISGWTSKFGQKNLKRCFAFRFDWLFLYWLFNYLHQHIQKDLSCLWKKQR